MGIKGSRRLEQLGSAIFAEIAEWKSEVKARGIDVIDLGIGSPDRPPSDKVIRALKEGVEDRSLYRYPGSEGSPEFRGTVAKWYRCRFGVELDPDREVLALMGSQDGLAHLALSVTDPGDVVMVPDPGYPIYAASLSLAGAEPYFVPLREESGYLPRLDEIPEEIARRAKLWILNYPSNPLSAVADRAFFEQWVEFARRYDILLAHDLAYSEMAFDGFKPPSILEVNGAKEVAVEFHSLSKSYNLAGCRIAYLVGNADAVKALRILKSNIDYGIYLAVQKAGIAALEEDMSGAGPIGKLYERRRDAMIERFAQHGWHIPKPMATMFIWAPVPQGWTSRQISREILLETGVVVVPGDAFGSEGEGYVRIALVQEEYRLLEAADRIGRFLQKKRRAGS
ncbi:aminotransferase class I/II-fold pyridoxal phosphate-dependent enzyme [Ferviditalea candida]|uniref:Aminotransferase n=1 Tax=Ferviditalea candida TaxID=3108399 RepID=A0ABU5ZF21_9BACL|nr:aminotransferase class I/II-fold pyridoxal phosphate-dependent enzyme [Paenibacillaceae bacterium T2]